MFILSNVALHEQHLPEVMPSQVAYILRHLEVI